MVVVVVVVMVAVVVEAIIVVVVDTEVVEEEDANLSSRSDIGNTLCWYGVDKAVFHFYLYGHWQYMIISSNTSILEILFGSSLRVYC